MGKLISSLMRNGASRVPRRKENLTSLLRSPLIVEEYPRAYRRATGASSTSLRTSFRYTMFSSNKEWFSRALQLETQLIPNPKIIKELIRNKHRYN